MIVIAMAIQYTAMGKRKYDFLDNGTEQVVPQPVGSAASAALSMGTVIFCLIALGIPVGSNLIMSFSSSVSIQKFQFTLENYIAVFRSGSQMMDGIKHSLGLALIAAAVGILVGFCVAYVLTYSKFGLKKVIDMMTLVAMAVAGMAKVPESLLTAAQMQGAGFGRRLRTVLLPLLHNSVVSAVLAAFGGSVFNLAITTILYPPNYSTLPVYISDSYNDLKFGYAAAATMIGAVFIITIMLILQTVLNLIGRGQSRIFQGKKTVLAKERIKIHGSNA